MSFYFGRYSGSRVTHGKDRIPAGDHIDVRLRKTLVDDAVARFDDQFAAIRHRVLGIDDQVHDHLLDMAGIDADGTRCRV